MSFKLDNMTEGRVECILNNIVCYEKIDKKQLLKVINSSLLKKDFNNPFCRKLFMNEKEQLFNYLEKINDMNGGQYIPVTYNKTNDMEGFGRVFPERSLGLHSIRRQIRHTLAKAYYIDIDIKNCHFELLFQLCVKADFTPKYLSKYIKNREKYIKLIEDTYLSHIITKGSDKNIKKDIAKRLYIRLLYFGTFENWLKDEKLEYNEEYEDANLFIKKFSEELNKIGKIIIKDNPELEKIVEDKKAKRDNDMTVGQYNKKGSIVSYYLQEYECRILECIFKFMVNKNLINLNKPDCVLCADGIMIPKDKYYDGLLIELEEQIKNEFDFDLKLVTKDMDEDYIDILDKSIINEDVYKHYEFMKEEFEKNHFKLMHPTLYVEIEQVHKDDAILVRNKTNFLDAYNHKYYLEEKIIITKGSEDKKVKYETKSYKFITRWINDAEMKIYNKMDFLPKMEVEEGVYNTFNGFKCEKMKIDISECDINNLRFEDTKIYEHIEKLCNNDENTINYFIKTLAMKIQKPYKIMGTSIIFKSIEGCGKDSFFNFFGNKVIGSKFYLNEDKIDLVFGRFNQCIENKLLVCVNETSGTDTFTKMNCIKNAITREVNIIERKGFEGYENRNCILFIFFTNNEVVMKIDGNERRFICIECDNSIAGDKKYFDALHAEFNNDLYAKLFYDYLMNIDLSNFDFIKDRPETNYYKTLREHNIPVFLKFVENEYYKHCAKKDKSYTDLFINFTSYLQEGNFKFETNRVKFGCEMKKYDFIEKKKEEKCMKYKIDFIKFKNYMIKNKYEFDFIE
jgi:hypothetical protein